LRFIHLSDSSKQPSKGQDGFDRLYKVRSLINLLNKMFRASFHPPKELSCDEMMVAFKGRSSLKQYIANKPIKRGFKLWALCSFDGFVLAFDVYAGATNGAEEDGLGTRAVKSLMNGFHHRGHEVFADRFFSSPALAEDLLEQGTFFTGTLKKGRKGFPKNLDPIPNRGDYSWRMKPNGLLAGIWKDSKEVPFISTCQPPSQQPMPTCKRKLGKDVTTLPIPPAIKAYNSKKAGVDIADQRRSYCHLRFKQLRRWWIPLFFALLDIMMENSRFLWNWGKEKGDVVSSKEFRLLLVEDLTKDLSFPSPVLDAALGHFPIHTDATNKRCKRCAMEKKEARTVWECQLCRDRNGRIALCVACFGPYHIEKTSPSTSGSVALVLQSWLRKKKKKEKKNTKENKNKKNKNKTKNKKQKNLKIEMSSSNFGRGGERTVFPLV